MLTKKSHFCLLASWVFLPISVFGWIFDHEKEGSQYEKSRNDTALSDPLKPHLLQNSVREAEKESAFQIKNRLKADFYQENWDLKKKLILGSHFSFYDPSLMGKCFGLHLEVELNEKVALLVKKTYLFWEAQPITIRFGHMKGVLGEIADMGSAPTMGGILGDQKGYGGSGVDSNLLQGVVSSHSNHHYLLQMQFKREEQKESKKSLYTIGGSGAWKYKTDSWDMGWACGLFYEDPIKDSEAPIKDSDVYKMHVLSILSLKKQRFHGGLSLGYQWQGMKYFSRMEGTIKFLKKPTYDLYASIFLDPGRWINEKSILLKEEQKSYPFALLIGSNANLTSLKYLTWFTGVKLNLPEIIEAFSKDQKYADQPVVQVRVGCKLDFIWKHESPLS